MALRLVKYESLLNTTHTHNADSVFLNTDNFKRNLNNTIKTVQLLANVVDMLNSHLNTTIKTISVHSGDVIVNIPFDYVLGSGLMVLRNGVFQNADIEYNELNDTQISIIMPCEEGEVFTFIFNEDVADNNFIYKHTQSIASNIWYITHGLNTSPVLVVMDDNNYAVNYGVEYNDDNTISILFNFPLAGKCICYGKIIGEDYTYINFTPSYTWHINHKLNKYPIVRIFDENDIEINGVIHYDDLNNITLSFNLEIVGKCICK